MSDKDKALIPKTIGEAWNMFSHRILDPINAERIQRQEMRRAFYAGVSTAITIITGNMSDEEEPTAEDFKILDNLVAELDKYSDSIRQGRA